MGRRHPEDADRSGQGVGLGTPPLVRATNGPQQTCVRLPEARRIFLRFTGVPVPGTNGHKPVKWLRENDLTRLVLGLARVGRFLRTSRVVSCG